jgi:hypothetical protein
MRTLFIVLALALTPPLSAQTAQAPTTAATKSGAVTIEYYYRIKWVKAGEFLKLYKKNHEPLLKEMQKRGFITAMKIDEPFTHMAGGTRWDLRVTISYRDGIAAVGDEPGGWDDVSDEIEKKLYPDKAGHEAEEARRMGLLEEHWDVLVYEVTD